MHRVGSDGKATVQLCSRGCCTRRACMCAGRESSILVAGERHDHVFKALLRGRPSPLATHGTRMRVSPPMYRSWWPSCSQGTRRQLWLNIGVMLVSSAVDIDIGGTVWDACAATRLVKLDLSFNVARSAASSCVPLLARPLPSLRTIGPCSNAFSPSPTASSPLSLLSRPSPSTRAT